MLYGSKYFFFSFVDILLGIVLLKEDIFWFFIWFKFNWVKWIFRGCCFFKGRLYFVFNWVGLVRVLLRVKVLLILGVLMLFVCIVFICLVFNRVIFLIILLVIVILGEGLLVEVNVLFNIFKE